MDDARAKLWLADGREVWRLVTVSYREVGSGRWISKEEVERLYPPEMALKPPNKTDTNTHLEQIRQQIVEVQAQIALDKQAGAQSTSAARLVLKALGEMEQGDQEDGQPPPWFVLGRQLAEQILALVEQECDPNDQTGSQN